MDQHTLSLEGILAAAVEIATAEDRRIYVERACAGNDALKEKVERMIANYFRAGDFLERPAALAETVDHPRMVEMIGTRIGAYKLLEQIGEGGMGIVYVAEQQQPIRRTVALKIIKPGMDSKQVTARFEVERQALALMDHPNIAKVLDAGTTDAGRPYFVMELVRGIPITEYCDKARLTVRQRLEVFVLVCRAVQHAHTKGVIHRDLKPSNVLVTSHDGVPAPLVIDFGVAKALGQQLTEYTLHTNFAQMIGTPLYMSPEQAEYNQLGVDTRSDIYSLGVLLYELLTGVTPFDRERMRAADYDELRRIIREEEPPRPSMRLTTLGAAALSTASDCRGVEMRKLPQMLRGELDWIVLKALEKDRNRRYETASAFAADVEHYLKDEQVEACPPSAGYRLRKFARRNRRVLAMTGVIAIALVSATVVSSRQAAVADRAKDKANRATEAEAEQHKRADANHERAETNFIRARELVDQFLKRIDARTKHDPRLRVAQRELIEEVLKFSEELMQQKGDDPSVRHEVGLAHGRVGYIQMMLDRPELGEEHARQAVDIFGRLSADFPSETLYRRSWANAENTLAGITMRRNQAAAAEDGFMRAVGLYEQLIKERPDDSEYRSRLVEVLGNLGALYCGTNRSNKGVGMFRRVIPVAEGLPRSGQSEYESQLAAAYSNLARALPAEESTERETLFRKAIQIQENLAAAHADVPDYREDLAISLQHQGAWLREMGKSVQADDALQKARAELERLLRDYPATPSFEICLVEVNEELAQLRLQSNSPGEAEAFLRLAIQSAKRLAEAHPTVIIYTDKLVDSLSLLALLMQRTDRPAEAVKLFRELVALLEKVAAALPESHDQKQRFKHELSGALNNLAMLLRDRGDYSEAQILFKRAIGLGQAALKADPDNVAYKEFLHNHYFNLGRTYFLAKEWQKATESFINGIEVVRTMEKDECLYLSIATWNSGDKDTARQYFALANDFFAKNPTKDKMLLRLRSEAAALLGIPANDSQKPVK